MLSSTSSTVLVSRRRTGSPKVRIGRMAMVISPDFREWGSVDESSLVSLAPASR